MSDNPRSPLMLVPPPLAFVLAFLAGVAINLAVPLVLPHPLAGIAAALGIAGVAAALALAASAVGLFILRRTTIIPFAQPARLVAAGPYRMTRNPMYVGLTLLFIGLALVIPSLWSLLFLPLPLLLLDRVVIPFEEARMYATFGAEYEDYCTRTGRWLTRGGSFALTSPRDGGG